MTTMRKIKCSISAFVLCITLLCSSTAGAALRIGIRELLAIKNGLPVQNYQKYEKLFINIMSQSSLFDIVSSKVFQKNIAFPVGGAPIEDTESYIDQVEIETGRVTKCRYVLTGYLVFGENHGKEDKAIFSVALFDIISRERQKFNIEVLLSQLSQNQQSSSSKSSPARFRPKSSSSKNDTQSIRERFAVVAFNQFSEKIREDIIGDIAQVTGLEDNRIILNRGLSSGVNIGDTYKIQAVISDGEVDIFGTNINEMSDIALVTVKKTDNNSSIAEIIENAGNINAIRVGDKIAKIPQAEVKKTTYEILSGTRPNFPDKRPDDKSVAVNNSATQKNAAHDDLPAIPAGAIRIGVLKFDSKAQNILNKEAAAATDLFIRFLSNSDKIIILERDRLEAIAREHRLNLSGLIDAETASEIGKLASCQYMLLGSITNANEKEDKSGFYRTPSSNSSQFSSALMLLADIAELLETGKLSNENVVKETYEMSVTIDSRLVNVETSKIEMAYAEEGSAAQTLTVTQDRNGITKSVESVNYGSLQTKAIESAVANLSNRITGKLTGEYLQIISIKDDELIINRGASAGINEAELLCVFPQEKTAGDSCAVIYVKDVQDDFSTAKMLFKLDSPNSVVKVGDRLEGVSYGDFEKGIMHIREKKRMNERETSSSSSSFESEKLSNLKQEQRGNNTQKLEKFSTNAKKVIKTYGLNNKNEKALITAHSKAEKMGSPKKKYESYVEIANSNLRDYLASYNAGKYAVELSMYSEAKEWLEKSLRVNPDYKPAQTLLKKIERRK